MQLNVTGHHVTVSPAMRDHVTAKLKRIERHFDHVNDIHCILTVEKLQHKAEATIVLAGGKIHADASSSDMYTAIDSLADKLDRQVRKFKEKLTDHHARDSGKPRFE